MIIADQIKQIKHFFLVDLWSVKLKNLPRRKRWLFKFLRIWMITIWEFKKDRISEKASNLTYFTLLSIVPVIAMAFGISKGFGLENVLERQLSNFFTGQEEVLENVLSYANKMIESANGGVITGIGLVILLYTVLRLMNNIEVTFNVMWDIKKHRPVHRKLADYISVMILGLLLILLSSSITVFIASEVSKLGASPGEYSGLKSGVLAIIRLIPYGLIWLLLFLLYLIFPNTRVKIVPALVAGIVAGTAYQLTQWGFITFQFAFSRYNAIYGSLAILPLFLIYVQLSWLIVLAGAELAYAMQHYDTWVPESENMKMSWLHKKKVALLLMHRIIKRFEEGKSPTTVRQLASKGSVPYRFILEICYDLEKAGLINRMGGDRDEDRFQPAFDIQAMDIVNVLKTFESEGLSDFDDQKSQIFQKIENAIDSMDELSKNSEHNKLVKNL